MCKQRYLVLFLFSLFALTQSHLAEASPRGSRAVAIPPYRGNFAGLNRGTLENIMMKVTSSKVDITYLAIAMNCTSVSDGMTYERAFLLDSTQVPLMNIRTTRAGRRVANKHFSATSSVGPRLGQIDISSGFSGRVWVVNVQVTAVAVDEGTSNIVENCDGTTIFHASKNLGRP